MKFTPDLLKAADHCQHRSFITNRYTGQRIAVNCVGKGLDSLLSEYSFIGPILS